MTRSTLLLAIRTGVALSLVGACPGCLNLKPVVDTSRYFVLSAQTPEPVPSSRAATSPRLGVGQVEIPLYLDKSWLAVRRGPDEIEYLENFHWAERLDAGALRVLGSNLSALLHTDQMQLQAWSRGMVDYEIYVHLNQFESDTTGQVVLAGRWFLKKPGENQALSGNAFDMAKQSRPPRTHPEDVVAAMSQLMAELSNQLAEAVKAQDASPSRRH